MKRFYLFYTKHLRKEYPNCMCRYFDELTTQEQFDYFLRFSEAASGLGSEKNLVSQSKWLLKNYPLELEYGLYIQLVIGDDYNDLAQAVSDELFDEWHAKYSERFYQEYEGPMLVQQEYHTRLTPPADWLKDDLLF
ncbi:hypothetical protein JZO70_13570 [Enterococcus sp. 669A]|uniref:Uncharacterized protein n=1 Tax=Candidatus Enterococcus moelleringii TaxID=2815325 RepID=A0ABS3LDL7_9ENTE|nr:hypothetical protein [Enterococcus sp. 669A]MBO1307200.1 hypothetical protein [Enterococcus sp. 669A]